ncbi:hypothetical protein CQW23_13116 [Capsicum baccatum]|uniref:LRR receptor-like serine/threonine-protein kinase n=1 Tax=Capsicum baccatum TaxID=33114 RepID=A0A2G2WUH3_CAPBA|nr:hypothetical protein CQW23_13116 [Capsicum baccatum]
MDCKVLFRNHLEIYLQLNHWTWCIPQGPQFHTFENNSYEGNDRLRGFPLSEGCGNDGHDSVSEETYAGSALDEESNSEFLNDFWKGALMGFQMSSVWRSGVGSSHFHYLLKIGNLTNLVYLDLNTNQISGTIPSQIGSLVKLQILCIFDNYLNGSIPEEIGYLRSLTKLSLGWNILNGSIPPSLGKLNNFTLLNLYENQLSGSVPVEIGYLRSLTELDLSTNFLNGSIPASLGNLNNLSCLYLYENHLSGCIPAQIGKPANLVEAYLEKKKQLTGHIPPMNCLVPFLQK